MQTDSCENIEWMDNKASQAQALFGSEYNKTIAQSGFWEKKTGEMALSGLTGSDSGADSHLMQVRYY